MLYIPADFMAKPINSRRRPVRAHRPISVSLDNVLSDGGQQFVFLSEVMGGQAATVSRFGSDVGQCKAIITFVDNETYRCLKDASFRFLSPFGLCSRRFWRFG